MPFLLLDVFSSAIVRSWLRLCQQGPQVYFYSSTSQTSPNNVCSKNNTLTSGVYLHKDCSTTHLADLEGALYLQVTQSTVFGNISTAAIAVVHSSCRSCLALCCFRLQLALKNSVVVASSSLHFKLLKSV